eukprot:11647432-Ditylum_brightwellii.AAC.1
MTSAYAPPSPSSHEEKQNSPFKTDEVIVSNEIIGKIKSKPEDFIVREVGLSKLIPYFAYNNTKTVKKKEEEEDCIVQCQTHHAKR